MKRWCSRSSRVGETTVGSSGHYVLAQLPIGVYSVTVEASSFVIQASQVGQLPSNGRHWAGLMLLAPGAVNRGDGSQGSTQFSGRANDDNNWTFEGVDNGRISDPGGFRDEYRDTDEQRPSNAVVQFQRTFRPQVLNETRLAFNRAPLGERNYGAFKGTFNVPGLSSLPDSSYNTFGRITSPFNRTVGTGTARQIQFMLRYIF